MTARWDNNDQLSTSKIIKFKYQQINNTKTQIRGNNP